MAARYILVLDGGSSAARCLVFDDRAEVVGSSAREWTYRTEKDAPAMARSFDPDGLWRTFSSLAGEAVRGAGIEGGQVSAVAVTSQRGAVAFLDNAGKEVYVGPNLDLRAVFEGAEMDEEFGDRLYRQTGHRPAFLFAPAKLKWFQRQCPEAYARISRVLTLADWLVMRLTGEVASEATLAGEAGLLDIQGRTWCSGLLSELGVVSSGVPLADPGTVVGRVTGDAASDTGLAPGTPVAVAGADTQCGLLGMGATDEAQVGVVAGWSTAIQMVTAQPVLPPGGKTWTGCSLARDSWVLESSAGDAGNSFRWLTETLCGSGPGGFQEMDALAQDVEPGAEKAMAYLGPSRMDAAVSGMRWGGILFPVPMTFSGMDRGQLARSALEAIAYAVRANLEQAEDVAGVRAADLLLGGGMTRTAAFATVLTDVVGRQIGLSPAHNVTALGAYLCASTSLGDFSSLEEASSSVRARLEVLTPDPAASAEYGDHYQRWNELAAGLEELPL